MITVYYILLKFALYISHSAFSTIQQFSNKNSKKRSNFEAVLKMLFLTEVN